MEENVMYVKSSRNDPKNKEKLVNSQPDDFKNMLKITHVRSAKQDTKKALSSERVSLRTKSNLLENLVTTRLPRIFLSFFFKNLINCHCEPSDLSV